MSSIELVLTVVATGLTSGGSAKVVVADDVGAGGDAETFAFDVPKEALSKYIVGDEVTLTIKPRIAP
jgi:hypothetical protein